MQFEKLQYNHVEATTKCVAEIISPLAFYSAEARSNEIDKFSAKNLWWFVEDKTRCNIVALDNNNVVGFLFGVADANVLFLVWIGMKEVYRRADNMTVLWKHMESWCQENNIHRIWCDTNQLNIPSIKFMEKMGMQKCGDFKDFWYNHDYFIWQKSLI